MIHPIYAMLMFLLGGSGLLVATAILQTCEGMHNLGFNCATVGIGLLMLSGLLMLYSMYCGIAYIYEEYIINEGKA